jgi:hypothetical protein
MNLARFVLAAALSLSLCLACRSAGEAPGVPLYPNAQTTRLPRAQIAQVAGPIAKIDDRDVADQGGVFDLLPGCHVVELDRRPVSDPYALSGGMYLSGQFPPTIYAFRMKPGARYVIRRDLITDSSGHARMSLFAREEEPTGVGSEVSPAQSSEDLRACRAWEATALRK